VPQKHACRWYRAPECLLTDGYYNYKMDMWGVGCVFFEIVSLFPLFPGTNELDQIQKIHSILGTPAPELLAKMKKRSAHMDFNFPPKVGALWNWVAFLVELGLWQVIFSARGIVRELRSWHGVLQASNSKPPKNTCPL